MTPDEVVKVLEEMHHETFDYNKVHLDKWSDVLSSAISLIQDYQKLKEEIERLRVQLAGCGVAALGYATGKNAIEKGSYGYSASFQDVVDLWDKHQKLRERVEKLNTKRMDIEVKQEENREFAFGMPNHELGFFIKGFNFALEKIQTYLQQPTEH
jgi:hypothetical protein